MERDFETMWVFRKDEKTHQLIKSYRFNSDLHKKLFWKNFFVKIKTISTKKINLNNPWIVGLGVGIILLAISLYLDIVIV